MALPGFSVSELISAINHVKTIYDAISSKDSNSSALVLSLSEEISRFQNLLEEYKKYAEEEGCTLKRADYGSIERTLEECAGFLNEYKILLDEGKFSLERAWRTASLPDPQSDVERLRRQIQRHCTILSFDMISNTNAKVRENSIALSARESHASPTNLLSGHINTKTQNEQYSGQHLELVLPQPALPYNVAQVLVGKKCVHLKRKPRGKNAGKYRALIIIDEKYYERFSHKIRLSDGQHCYPYTWHSEWKEHQPLEVTFQGLSPDRHSIEFKGQPVGSGIPTYTFAKREDYIDFQAEVRGKELVDYFEFEKIRSASLSKYDEAKYEHLKVWRDQRTQDYSISFYANAREEPRNLEFPIAMFHHMKTPRDLKVVLDFTFIARSKWRASKSISRSSSAGSSSPSLFRFSHTAFLSRRSSLATTISTSASVNSVASSDVHAGMERLRSTTTEELVARKMRYLEIDFSTREDANRFLAAYDRAHKDQDTMYDWRLDTNTGQGPDSTITSDPIPDSIESTISNDLIPNSRLLFENHEAPDTSSPLKKRLDEMDQIFSFPIRSGIAAQSPSTRPTALPPPSAQSFVSNQPPKVPPDALPQQWQSWSPAPSVVSPTLPASPQAAPPYTASDLLYSQVKTESLQEKLNTTTQTMISANLGSTYTPSFSLVPSTYSGLPPASSRATLNLTQTPLGTGSTISNDLIPDELLLDGTAVTISARQLCLLLVCSRSAAVPAFIFSSYPSSQRLNTWGDCRGPETDLELEIFEEATENDTSSRLKFHGSAITCYRNSINGPDSSNIVHDQFFSFSPDIDHCIKSDIISSYFEEGILYLKLSESYKDHLHCQFSSKKFIRETFELVKMVMAALPDPYSEPLWGLISFHLKEIIRTTVTPFLSITAGYGSKEANYNIGKNKIKDNAIQRLSFHCAYYGIPLHSWKLTPFLHDVHESKAFPMALAFQSEALDFVTNETAKQLVTARYELCLEDRRLGSFIGYILTALSSLVTNLPAQKKLTSLVDWWTEQSLVPESVSEYVPRILLFSDTSVDHINILETHPRLAASVGIGLADRGNFASATTLLEISLKLADENLVYFNNVEYNHLSAELVKCYNALNQKAKGETWGFHALNFVPVGDYNGRIDVLYLKLATADALIGQAKYESATDILEEVIEAPEASKYLITVASLRMSKLWRRKGEIKPIFRLVSVLESPNRCFDALDSITKVECMAEIAATISQLRQTESRHLSVLIPLLEKTIPKLSNDKDLADDWRLQKVQHQLEEYGEWRETEERV